jgi:hypothetical protein
MADEVPAQPPPQVPIRTFTTPNVVDGFFTERIDVTAPNYVVVERGALYKDQIGSDQRIVDLYPELFFVKETASAQSYPWALRTWATDHHAESSYNAAITYVSENVGVPMFTRVYTTPRGEYEANPTRTIGTPLDELINVKITDPGENYTFATATLTPENGAAIDLVVSQDGTIIEAVVTKSGSGFTSPPTITIVGDGGAAQAVGYLQPQTALLISQKKDELPDSDPLAYEFVQVTNVYETLPTSFTETTEIDEDGVVITKNTRRNINADIVSQETLINGVWCNTTKNETTDFAGEEIVQCRTIPGNPIDSPTKLDDDGVPVYTVRTMKDVTTIVTEETLVTNNGGFTWVKTYIEPLIRFQAIHISDLVAWEVVESRAIPGNPMDSDKLDEDGVPVHVVKTMERAATIAAITPRETISTGVWTRITSEAISDLVAWKIVETRTLPGNPIDAPVKIEDDGVPLFTVRTVKDITTITPGEAIIAGNWVKTSIEPHSAVSDLVAWEVVEARAIPGNTIPSINIGGDYEIADIDSELKDESTITPSATESGGFITTVESKEVSDLVSRQVTTVKKWLDEAFYSVSIPNLIPDWARALIPTTTESHILIGTASLPTLASGEFEHSEKQLNKLQYENRITSFNFSGEVTLTNQATTTRYGGGDIDIILKLNVAGSYTLDEGLTVLSSKIDNLGNGYEIKVTEQLHSGTWPTISSFPFDVEMQILYQVDEQVVDPSYTIDVTYDGTFIEELRNIDKWKSRRIRTIKNPTAVDDTTAIISERWRAFQFPGYLVLTLTGLGYYVRHAHSDLCQQIIKTWWVISVGEPVIAVDEIVMDNPIISTLNSTTTLAYSGECLHDTFTSFGVFVWPATTPDMTTYTGTWIGTSRVIAADVTPTEIPTLWKIKTVNVVMR